MVLGLRIKEARFNKNLTQQELANLIGVSKTSICLYEKGGKNPSLKTFQKLSNVLNVSPEYLMGNDLGVMEQEHKIYVNISKQDLEILSELRKYSGLYSKLYEDPKRTIKLIDKKLKDRLY